MFIVQNNYQQLEQLSTPSPYRRAWRWDGKKWIAISSRWGDTYLPITLAMIVVVLMIWLPLTLQSSAELTILFWGLLALLLAILPILMVWLAHWY